MWLVGSKVSDVYLGTRAFAACERGVPVHLVDVANAEAGLTEFGKWLDDGLARRRVRLWLSGGLCRPFIVPSVEGVADDGENLAVASAMAPRLTGLMGSCRVFVERSASKVPVLAIAVQADRVAQIKDLVASSMSKPILLSLRPWWAEALRYGLQRQPTLAAIGVQDCDSMTVLIGRDADRFDVATTYAPVTDQRTAASVLTRALLSSNVTNGEELVGRLVIRRSREESAVEGLALGCFAEFSR